MTHHSIAAAIGLAICAIAFSHADDNAKPQTSATATDRESMIASRLAGRGAKKNKGAYDAKTYLAELSAEGRQRGYKEFTYKQTPEGRTAHLLQDA